MLRIIEKAVMFILVALAAVIIVITFTYEATGKESTGEYITVKGRMYLVTDEYILPADEARYTR